MVVPPTPAVRVRFAYFELDLGAGELRRNGAPVPIPEQPLRLLEVLVEHPGRLISRDVLRERLWPADTFVDFEHGLNAAVKRLRDILGDSADAPRFIETVPKRGYRFVCPVEPPSTVAAVRPPDPPPPARVAASGGWLGRSTWRVVAVTVVLGVVALAARWSVGSEPSRRTVGFDLGVPSGVSVRPEYGLAGVSPDGRHLAVVAQRGNEALAIWVRDLAGGDAAPLAGSESPSLPFWSPDSRSLGFFQKGRLRVIDIKGGPPRDLCAASGRGGTWNADGTIVFAANTRSGLSRISASGGTPSAVTVLDPGRRDVSHRYPSFLPDGRHFVFLVWAGEVERAGIYLGDLEGSPPVRLLPDLSPAIWTAGHLLFVRRETLVAQPMRATRLIGDASVVATPVGRDPSDYVSFAASPSGDLVFQRRRMRSQLEWFDRSGRRLGTFGPPAHWADPAISPDGTRLAFVYRDRAAGNENLDVWIADQAGRMHTRVTLDAAIDVLPVLNRDGSELIFRSNRSGFSDLYRKRPDSSAPESVLLSSSDRKDPTDWSSDGRWVLFTVTPATGPPEIWLYDVEKRSAPRPVVKEAQPAFNARFSPDGRYIAFESALTGRREVYVQALDEGGRRWRVSADGGAEPAWRADGLELFFTSDLRRVHVVDVAPKRDELTFGAPRTLFEVPMFAGLRNSVAVSPDGQRFLISVDVPESHPTQVVLNWLGQAVVGDR